MIKKGFQTILDALGLRKALLHKQILPQGNMLLKGKKRKQTFSASIIEIQAKINLRGYQFLTMS